MFTVPVLTSFYYLLIQQKNFLFQVLEPLIQDLLLLEHGIDGLQAGVAFYAGDNLELHEIGGFNRVFSSGHICRFCQVHYSELAGSDGYLRNQLWTSEQYDHICSSLESGNIVEDFSLRGRCPLNQLASFHATTSLAPDVMHDFLEGVVPMDLVGVLKCFVKEGWFTVDQYNDKLR
jgi:hypothetical protein